MSGKATSSPPVLSIHGINGIPYQQRYKEGIRDSQERKRGYGKDIDAQLLILLLRVPV
jgi:hypothetical protein